MTRLPALLDDIQRCQICSPHLPQGPRPVLQAGAGVRILIAGQAPGRKVHASGIPFDDASGDRLRDWLGVSPESFYDPACFAILPMGFCYPGSGHAGDLPPRPECAATWRQALLAELRTGSMAELSQVLERIRLLKGIRSTETSIHLATYR